MSNMNELYMSPSKVLNVHNKGQNGSTKQNAVKCLQSRSVLHKKGLVLGSVPGSVPGTVPGTVQDIPTGYGKGNVQGPSTGVGGTGVGGTGVGGTRTETGVHNREKKNISDNTKTYEFLDASHLELLDLNKNIESILPPAVKPLINLETVCKATVNSQASMHNAQMNMHDNMANNRFNSMYTNNNFNPMNTNANDPNNMYRSCQLQVSKNVKHLYEMGPPNIVGTYINPLKKNSTCPMNTISTNMNTINNNNNNLTSFNTTMPLPASPFFQPPAMNMSQQLIPPTNQFMQFQINKNTNLYGLPSFVIPENKPPNLTVTTIPIKDKEKLEQEAKKLKQLLDSCSQGVVNSNPDYQTISSATLFNNTEKNAKEANENSCNNSNNGNNSTNSNHLSSNNEKNSDFSFGKQEHTDSCDEDFNHNYEDSSYINETNCINNTYMDTNYETVHKKIQFDGEQMEKHKNNSTYFNCLQGEQYTRWKMEEPVHTLQNGMKPEMSEGEINDKTIYYDTNNKSEQENVGTDDYGNEKAETKSGMPKREHSTTSSFKTYEPSTSFKHSKRYINIRLGRPKYPYITDSADPIDKKLKDWHNSHNSQIKWKKIKRGVYLFGKTEIVLSILHDKIIVKKIDGQTIKDNLLTVEKFVSLNELNELERQEDSEEKFSQDLMNDEQ